MKMRYLLLLVIAVPLLAGQVTLETAAPVLAEKVALQKSAPFTFLRGDTLKYDLGTFTTGLGLTGSGTPGADQTLGFATYFVLSEFGITDPKKVGSILLHFNSINGTDFRLYVWTDAGGVPNSHATHLYSDMSAPLGSPGVWTEYDLAAYNVNLPDTFWVGMCYNVLSTPADWYLSLDQNMPDIHTYGNLSGGPGDWVPMGNYGYGFVYGVRVVVEDTTGVTQDVGATAILAPPGTVPPSSAIDPEATYENFGSGSETFDVYFMIDSAGSNVYSETANITLDPFTDTTITWPTWTAGPSDGIVYDLTAYTVLAGDTDPANDTVMSTTTTSSWLYYDDGSVASGWAWYYQDNGWGVQFPVVTDLWVDSIACFIYSASWPSPGGNDATFRIYDGAAQPTNLRQEWLGVTIVRGAWNYFECDTTLTKYYVGDNIFLFYVQYLDAFDCPALAIDGAVDAPPGMLWWYNGPGTFGQGNNGGDWLLRVHVIPEVGIAEWIAPSIPDESILRAPSIITSKTVMFEFTLPEKTMTELQIYDATGRLRRTLVSNTLPAGKHSVSANLDLAAGIYFINLRTESGIDVTSKSLFLK